MSNVQSPKSKVAAAVQARTFDLGLWTLDWILAVAEGFEPSIAGLTIRCLTNLATPQKERGETGERVKEKRKVTLVRLSLSTFPFSPFTLEAMKGVEPLSSGLQDRRSVIRLSYIAI